MLAKNEITVSRLIDAPQDAVFRAWTEPARLKRWWGPKGFTTPHCTVDLRMGGLFHYCMRSPEGKDYWGRGIYREVSAPDRIAYMDSFADEAGEAVEPTAYGMSEDFPADALVTVEFSREEDKTKVTVRHALPASAPEREACQQGWMEMLERLEEELSEGE
jgi:uncharacterized protein YndB with AHSA1/START domain